MTAPQTTGTARLDSPKRGHRGRQVFVATLLTAGAFVASGWFAYAVPFEANTGAPAAAPANDRPVVMLPLTGDSSRDLPPTPEPTQTPATIRPTVVPTAAPTHAPTVRPTVPPTPRPPQTTFTIPVPIYAQTMPLDCETGALAMGLATFGHHYSQATLFAQENADLRPAVLGPNHTVLQWGDPYTNFVGNVWGSESGATGYGVYYPPILTIARSHGLPNSYGGEGLAPSTVYRELAAGHPVEAWIESNWTPSIVGSWTAWDGRKIRYSYHEHALTLSGVSPTRVRVNDPWHGTQYWVSKAAFEAVWADFNNMAVVFK